jgi:hypothetical protein
MVVLKIIHSLMLHMIDPAKLQFYKRNVKDTKYKSYSSKITYAAQQKWTGIQDVLLAPS